jgi:hypothetical protein
MTKQITCIGPTNDYPVQNKFHEISWTFDGIFFLKKSFMKFHEFFHEISLNLSWNFMKLFMQFHEQCHHFMEWFSPGLNQRESWMTEQITCVDPIHYELSPQTLNWDSIFNCSLEDLDWKNGSGQKKCIKFEWRKKWLESKARLNETGKDWSAPELCSRDS